MLLSNEKLDIILNDPDLIERIIKSLAYAFPDIVYQINPNGHQDPYNYYLFGYCATFARILFILLNQSCLLYSNGSHVIVRIQNNFYDIRGLLDNKEAEGFHPIGYEDLLYLEDVVFRNNYTNQLIMKEEINVGLIEMQQIIKEYDEKKKSTNLKLSLLFFKLYKFFH